LGKRLGGCVQGSGERLLVVSAASELRVRGLLRSVELVANAGFWASRPETDAAGVVLAVERGTLGRLDALRWVDHDVEQVRSALVARARVEGSSWRLIAAAVGGTPRSVRDRYGKSRAMAVVTSGGVAGGL